jgi:hypothetical protein
MWFALHSIALNYPDRPTLADRRVHHEFFHALARVLPCAACREHFAAALRETPVEAALGSRADLFRWLVDVHNRGNVRDGKPEMPADEALSLYMRAYATGRGCDCDLRRVAEGSRDQSSSPSARTLRTRCNRLTLALVAVSIAALCAIAALVWVYTGTSGTGADDALGGPPASPVAADAR